MNAVTLFFKMLFGLDLPGCTCASRNMLSRLEDFEAELMKESGISRIIFRAKVSEAYARLIGCPDYYFEKYKNGAKWGIDIDCMRPTEYLLAVQEVVGIQQEQPKEEPAWL